MRVTRDPLAPGPIVAGFSGNGFRVGEIAYPALLLSPDWHEDWAPPPLDALTFEALAGLIAERPEFILIGTGATLRRPPQALVRALEDRNIGVEVLNSRTAARDWGVLRGEGRQIGAALYPLDA